ncbi:MerR family transcriptional regulator [Massilia sp. YMA4]|uniref:MerR family transcriptional regulator n=1 Tax=Massilia sp. YMA4 TaxID=1593482 RepID=UPI000DD1363C|nr:MerR family transcriptional regulator [Massilia sp. YMA4]AXA92338.1 cobalamin-binding protein [Massilia sp. YMA4]
MNTSELALPPCSISDVERDTGVAKETLRVWERRYDFPQPQRDPFGERLYPFEQVQKLRLVKRLIDLGFRPGKVLGQSTQELQQLAEQAASASRVRPRAPSTDLEPYVALCRSHQTDALRRKLSQALLMMGLKSFVLDVMAPLTTLVGDAWACGDIAVHEEHLITEALQTVIRSAIFSLPQPEEDAAMPQPRILLTTPPQEKHGLGLLMAEALMTADGAHCVALGTQTPLPDIVEAARGQHCDIVALSFSTTMNPRHVLDALKELRTRLPDDIVLWAGGANPALRRRAPGFVKVLALAEVGAALAGWREQAALPA